MIVYRIAAGGSTYRPEDITGRGAAANPGRWNLPDERVVYAADSIALAMLETGAHLGLAVPMNRYVIEIEIPDSIWAKRRIVTEASLPGGWDAIPNSIVSQQFGSEWYQAHAEAVCELPSVLVREEKILLINAVHPDAADIKATTGRLVDYRTLFRM